jgi:thioredoxin-like negative regulator of GroEL
MIELMLEAERALAVGRLDRAEQLYAQVVAADPRNAIAVVGLARVALERDDQRGAYTFARQALVLDPENPMASHMARRMAEIMAGRGEVPPGEAPPGEAPAVPEAPAGAAAATTTAGSTGPPPRQGLLGRVLRRRR